MPKRPPAPDLTAEFIALMKQAVRIAELIKAQQTPAARSNTSGLGTGIYSHQSKYNPFRAYYNRDGVTTYLGAFPSIAQAKAARQAFANGKPIKDGTKARPVARLVRVA